MDNGAVTALIIVGVGAVIFGASRMFWLWYFGVSRIIAVLESIDESLAHLPAVQEYRWRKTNKQAA